MNRQALPISLPPTPCSQEPTGLPRSDAMKTKIQRPATPLDALFGVHPLGCSEQFAPQSPSDTLKGGHQTQSVHWETLNAQSGRGLPHSKMLSRDSEGPDARQV